jgi:hypothetical protein
MQNGFQEEKHTGLAVLAYKNTFLLALNLSDYYLRGF